MSLLGTNDKNASSRRIQRFWRKCKADRLMTSDLVDKYVSAGPSVQRVKRISFEELTVFLREKSVVAATDNCLRRISMLSALRQGSFSQCRVNARVFLAGFMIAFHPAQVFKSMAEKENSLFDAASLLIGTFERICACLEFDEGMARRPTFSDVPLDLTRDFTSLLLQYVDRFVKWKTPVSPVLTSRLRIGLVAMYETERQLPPDEPDDSKLKVELRTQIGKLRAEFLKVAGVDALKAFDEQRERMRTGVVVPFSDEPAGAGGMKYPARREQLAHELLLNPRFQFDGLGRRVGASFHSAFFDRLVGDLKLTPPSYECVLRVLTTIRDNIMQLANSQDAMAIADVVDVDFIRRQTDAGLFDWNACRRLIAAIVDIIRRVQLPERNDETESLWRQIFLRMEEETVDTARVFCEALAFLTSVVSVMRVDSANANLRKFSPVIGCHGVDYERRRFQHNLDNGTVTLSRTTEWISAAVQRQVVGASYLRIHSDAMIGLVSDPMVDITGQTCPETLQLDLDRLSALQREFRCQVSGAAILVRVSTAPFAKTVVDGVVKLLFGEVEAGCRVVPVTLRTGVLGPVLAGAVSPLPEEEGPLLKNAADTVDSVCAFLENAEPAGEWSTLIRQCLVPTDPLRRLMVSRLSALWLGLLCDGRLPDDAFVYVTPSLPVLVPRIYHAVSKLELVARVNSDVHSDTYTRLIAEAAR